MYICSHLAAFEIKKRLVVNKTYLTTDELSARIKYDARTIRERLKDSVLLEPKILS